MGIGVEVSVKTYVCEDGSHHAAKNEYIKHAYMYIHK